MTYTMAGMAITTGMPYQTIDYNNIQNLHVTCFYDCLILNTRVLKIIIVIITQKLYTFIFLKINNF